jgi:endo-1,4-beta-xylanase
MMLCRLIPLAVLLPLCSAQLNLYAEKADLKYFGTATDSPGERERAGLEADYPQYDAILTDHDEFGQTTASNGQKVRWDSHQLG